MQRYVINIQNPNITGKVIYCSNPSLIAEAVKHIHGEKATFKMNLNRWENVRVAIIIEADKKLDVPAGIVEHIAILRRQGKPAAASELSLGYIANLHEAQQAAFQALQSLVPVNVKCTADYQDYVAFKPILQ